jgi:hypothetical protein
MTEHDFTTAYLASTPNWAVAIFALVTQADVPLWAYILIAVVLPFALVAFKTFLDHQVSEWKTRRESKK